VTRNCGPGSRPLERFALGIYDIKGGNLAGTWLPVNAADDKSVLGFENLVGAPQLAVSIRSRRESSLMAESPTRVALNIDPLTEALNTDAKCYRVRCRPVPVDSPSAQGTASRWLPVWGADF